MTLTIQDGTHTDDGTPAKRRLGYLYALNGAAIPVYADCPLDAYLQAIGPAPQPPELLSGRLVPVYGFQGLGDRWGDLQQVETGYQPDPSQDSLNAAEAQIFAAWAQLWKDHAGVVQEQLKTILDMNKVKS